MKCIPFVSLSISRLLYRYLTRILLFISYCGMMNQSFGITNMPSYCHPFAFGLQQAATQSKISPKHFDLIHTKLELKFNEIDRQLQGAATLQVKPHCYAQQEIVLDAPHLSIHHVCIPSGSQQEGQVCSYVHRGHQLVITLDRLYTQDEVITLEIGYMTCCKDQVNALELAQDPDVASMSVARIQPFKIWSQNEIGSQVDWFPTLDIPYQRCTQEVYITVNDALQTLSNGILVYTTLNEDQTRTDYWHMDLPHSPHFFMLAIGKWREVADEWNDIPIHYYMDPDTDKQAEDGLEYTKELLSYFSEKWDYPYPWPKFDQLLIKGYQHAAMGGTTAIAWTTHHHHGALGISPAMTQALCRHWFGSLVSCELGSQRCFNEAFIALGVYDWYAYKYGPDERDRLMAKCVEVYQKEVQHKSADTAIPDGKDGMGADHQLSCHKSALIFHMLRAYLGEEAFGQSLKQYIKKYAFATADIHQVRKIFEEVSGQDLTWFFNQWFLAPGHPELKIEYAYQNAQLVLRVWQKQVAPSPLYQLPLAVDVWVKEKKETYHLIIDQAYQEIRWPVEEDPTLVYFDRNYILAGKITLPQNLQSAMCLYEHGDDLWSKLEAVEQLKHNKADLSTWYHVVSKATDWFLKVSILQRVGPYTVKDKDYLLWEAQLMELVEDTHESVREAALYALCQGPTPSRYLTTYRNALEDTADSVMEAALNAYIQYQQEGPEKEAILLRFEADDTFRMIKILINYYIKCKRTDKYGWLQDKTRQLYEVPGYEGLLESLVDYTCEVALNDKRDAIKLMKEILSSHPSCIIASMASKGLHRLSKGKIVKDMVVKHAKTQKSR